MLAQSSLSNFFECPISIEWMDIAISIVEKFETFGGAFDLHIQQNPTVIIL